MNQFADARNSRIEFNKGFKDEANAVNWRIKQHWDAGSHKYKLTSKNNFLTISYRFIE